jgi:hypothetical protein
LLCACAARAGGGKGSFNWRFKTDLKLGPFDEADTSPVVLQLNLENCHVFGAPTNLGSGEIDLTQWCQRLYRTARVGWESVWHPIERVSREASLTPKCPDLAEKLKEKGRDAPFSPKTQYYRPKDMAFDGKIGGFYDLMDVVMSGELANMAFAEDPEDGESDSRTRHLEHHGGPLAQHVGLAPCRSVVTKLDSTLVDSGPVQVLGTHGSAT